MNYVCNAFSLQMISGLKELDLRIVEIEEDTFRFLSKIAESYIGHKDMAKRYDLAYNREELNLTYGDVLYVSQLQKERNPQEINGKEEQEVKYYQIVWVQI